MSGQKAETIIVRDQFLDMCRGFLLLIIIIDHVGVVLPRADLLLPSLIFEAIGYVSAAEGFVFLSGYVASIVYTRALQSGDVPSAFIKAYKRSGGIYLWYLFGVAATIYTAKLAGLSYFIDLGNWETLAGMSVTTAVWRVAILDYQPLFLEILPMYAVLTSLTPLVVLWMNSGHIAKVLLTSVSVWAAAQCGAREFLTSLLISDSGIQYGFFDILGWQLIYFSGLVVGRVKIRGEVLIPVKLQPFCDAVALIGVLYFFLARHEFVPEALGIDTADRSRVSFVRVINLTCVLLILSRLRARLDVFGKGCFLGISFLGKNSLSVFSLHLVPILLGIKATTVVELSPRWLTETLLLCICVVGTVQIAVARNFLRWSLRYVSREFGSIS